MVKCYIFSLEQTYTLSWSIIIEAVAARFSVLVKQWVPPCVSRVHGSSKRLLLFIVQIIASVISIDLRLFAHWLFIDPLWCILWSTDIALAVWHSSDGTSCSSRSLMSLHCTYDNGNDNLDFVSSRYVSLEYELVFYVDNVASIEA